MNRISPLRVNEIGFESWVYGFYGRKIFGFRLGVLGLFRLLGEASSCVDLRHSHRLSRMAQISLHQSIYCICLL